jgi:hypothetical protein
MTPHPTALPPPGLSGDYQDSCIICLKGTDTGLAFRHAEDPETWAAAGLTAIGLSTDVAIAVVEHYADKLECIDADDVYAFRVCAGCAGPFPVGLLATGVPIIAPR